MNARAIEEANTFRALRLLLRCSEDTGIIFDFDGNDSCHQGAPLPLSDCGIDIRLFLKLEIIAPGVALALAPASGTSSTRPRDLI